MIAVLAAALVITGCQNSGYLLKTYSASVARKHVVQTAGGSFWVFDRPDLGKIMTFAAVRTVMRSVDEIVRDDPVQLFEAEREDRGRFIANTDREHVEGDAEPA
ncbi:hypothetical protein [Mesorhizobium sp. M0701]|uniref:hypothetical protein n=1 Tax=Mesorhizobium sp. M0701 TaxID=2956989 RepID=UPI00333A6A74